MSFARDTYTGNGVTTTFTVSFPYIQKSHVQVYLDGVLKALTTDYIWASASQIQFNSAPANGVKVLFLRVSNQNARLVDFSQPSNLDEADLDLEGNQGFFIAQEAIDQAHLSIVLDSDDKYDAASKVIKNVATPTNGNDAVNKTYVDSIGVSSGNVPPPQNPADNNKLLKALNGSYTWAVTLSSYMEGLLGTASAAALRTALDVPGLTTANVFTKTQTRADGGDVATTGSALTLPEGNVFNLTGTSAVPGFATKGVGTDIIVRHNAAHQLTHHATDFVLKTGATFNTAAGDHSFWHEYQTGKWRMTNYAKADGTALVVSAVSSGDTGDIKGTARRTPPSGWLMCDGSAVSRTTFSALFAAICPTIGTFTVTIASPGVVTLNGHGLETGDRIRLFTSGALPTGLTANTDYFVIKTSANAFNLATSLSNALASTAINTTGSQSGTHTAQDFAWGAGDGSTTFNLPDGKGRTFVGRDGMGGSAANRLTNAGSGIAGNVLGASGGAETHTLQISEIPSHDHQVPWFAGGAGGNLTKPASANATSSPTTTTATGGGGAHNNTQPTFVGNWIIKT